MVSVAVMCFGGALGVALYSRRYRLLAEWVQDESLTPDERAVAERNSHRRVTDMQTRILIERFKAETDPNYPSRISRIGRLSAVVLTTAGGLLLLGHLILE